MAARPRKSTSTNKVDVTVENQENPISSEEKRESTETVSAPEVPKMAPANEVDETVQNQMNPGTSEEERESTDAPAEDKDATKAWDTLAPANEVDETVHNQMNPGLNMVDRNPEPEVVEDSAGIKYDVSKPYPELITDESSPEEQQRKARVRQTEAVLRAKDVGETEESDRKYIEIEFLESGLTTNGHVWKKGEVLKLEDNEDTYRLNKDIEDNVWFEQSASEQEERYGKVMFEKR